MNKQYKVTVNGKEFDVSVEEIGQSGVQQSVQTVSVPKQEEVVVSKVQEVAPVATPATPSVDTVKITSPMPGNIWKILKKANDKVNKHETILILEVMKMENEIVAPEAGTITNILVNEGNKVDAGQLIIVMIAD